MNARNLYYFFYWTQISTLCFYKHTEAQFNILMFQINETTGFRTHSYYKDQHFKDLNFDINIFETTNFFLGCEINGAPTDVSGQGQMSR